MGQFINPDCNTVHGKYPGQLLSVILWPLIKAGRPGQQLQRQPLLKSILLLQTLLLGGACRNNGLPAAFRQYVAEEAAPEFIPWCIFC